MKKIILFVFLGIIAFLLIAIIILPFVLPLDKIKDFATTKMSEILHRPVKIESISFNLFTGVKLTGFYIGNRSGFSQQAFVSAETMELRYNPWPLLVGKLVIDKIVLVKPQVLIERSANSEFNFSDLMGKKVPKKKEPAKKPPFSFFISKFALVDGQLTFKNYTAQEIQTSKLADINTEIKGITLATTQPITLNARATGFYKDEPTPIKLTGKAEVNLEEGFLKAQDLTLQIREEKLATNAEISNLGTAPQIKFSVRPEALVLANLLDIFSPGFAEETKTEALLKDIPIKELRGNLSLQKKILDIKDVALESRGGNAKLTFVGKVDLNYRRFVSGNRLTLTLAPSLTQSLSPEYDVFKDKSGWTTVEFELRGSLTKPIPVPLLGKTVERAKEKAKEQLRQEIEIKKEELKQEAEQKLKELFKF